MRFHGTIFYNHDRADEEGERYFKMDPIACVTPSPVPRKSELKAPFGRMTLHKCFKADSEPLGM